MQLTCDQALLFFGEKKECLIVGYNSMNLTIPLSNLVLGVQATRSLVNGESAESGY